MSRASETFGFAGDAQLASGASAAQQTKSEKRQSSLEVYAYSFWRSGAQAQAPLGSGQYGGSQSAVIAALPLLRFRSGNTAPKLAFIGRAAVAHGNSKEREIAAGLRWRPLQHLPLHLTAERRFRHARADAVAVYLAGGKSGIGLPLGFKLDSYGQTGFVSGKGGGAFADFNARADRQILKSGKAAMAGGAGIWGGGQAEVMRVDIGPTVRADIAAGAAQFRLTADWRFRVAGSARPGDGPAITLSTSF